MGEGAAGLGAAGVRRLWAGGCWGEGAVGPCGCWGEGAAGHWRGVGLGGCWSEGAASPEVCWTEGTVGPGAARKGARPWPRRQPPLLGDQD